MPHPDTTLAPSALAGARMVVTGGAGFLGAHLCRTAVHAGAHVVCIDDESSGDRASVADLADLARFEFVSADVAEGLPVRGPVDVVLHLASTASPVHYRRRPIATLRSGSLGTLHALELAHAHSARFVLASTSEVYGDPQVHPQVETYWGHVNPLGERSCYDESKRFAEAAVMAFRREHGTDAGIARIFNTYGPGMRTQDGRVVPAFIDQALRGVPLTVAGTGAQTRSLCYVSDTVDALLRLTASDVAGPVNVGNPHEVTVAELAEIVCGAAQSESTIEHIPLPEDDPARRCPDIALAERLLGWRPTVSLDDGLARTIAWFRSARQPAAHSRSTVSH